jgi:hypothetical protein
MGALKDEWRKPSSYLSWRDGRLGVELGRGIVGGEWDHSSASTSWRRSGVAKEAIAGGGYGGSA